jgi:F-type H+-transporting ATPase subunit delta
MDSGMKNSKQIKREAKRLFRLCLVNGLLDEQRVRLAVQGVLQSKRRGIFAVLAHFLRLVRFDRSRHTAVVESVTSLPVELQSSVLARLDRLYGPRIHTSFSLNPTLIGGMRIRVGSDLYDGSIKAGLATLESRF